MQRARGNLQQRIGIMALRILRVLCQGSVTAGWMVKPSPSFKEETFIAPRRRSRAYNQNGSVTLGSPKRMLPNKPRGVPRVNDRRVLNGIFWVLQSEAPSRDFPEAFGPYTTCHNRFVRWCCIRSLDETRP